MQSSRPEHTNMYGSDCDGNEDIIVNSFDGETNTRANCYLSVMYENGKGAKPDQAKALVNAKGHDRPKAGDQALGKPVGKANRPKVFVGIWQFDRGNERSSCTIMPLQTLAYRSPLLQRRSSNRAVADILFSAIDAHHGELSPRKSSSRGEFYAPLHKTEVGT